MSDLEKKLWRRVERYGRWLRFVPGVRMVAVCNNLAFGAVRAGSDIDLFVVARRGQLFTARLLITLFLQLCGVRRHGRKVAGRFCLSFFIDDSDLSLERIALEEDVYLAFWIATLKPVVDDGVSAEFLNANQWVRDLLAFEPEISAAAIRPRGLQFFSFFERWVRAWQLRRARRKMVGAGAEASLVVNEHMLKFHNLDRRELYRDSWISKYGSARVERRKFIKLFDMSKPITSQLTSALRELHGFSGVPSSYVVANADDDTTWSGDGWELKKIHQGSYNVHCGR